jgi:hypothetical protein
LTQYNRAVSTTMATRSPQIIVTCTAPVVLAGMSTAPQLTFTLPLARIDGRIVPPVSGRDGLIQSLSGVGLRDASNKAITIVYKSNDAAP